MEIGSTLLLKNGVQRNLALAEIAVLEQQMSVTGQQFGIRRVQVDDKVWIETRITLNGPIPRYEVTWVTTEGEKLECEYSLPWHVSATGGSIPDYAVVGSSCPDGFGGVTGDVTVVKVTGWDGKWTHRLTGAITGDLDLARTWEKRDEIWGNHWTIDGHVEYGRELCTLIESDSSGFLLRPYGFRHPLGVGIIVIAADTNGTLYWVWLWENPETDTVVPRTKQDLLSCEVIVDWNPGPPIVRALVIDPTPLDWATAKGFYFETNGELLREFGSMFLVADNAVDLIDARETRKCFYFHNDATDSDWLGMFRAQYSDHNILAFDLDGDGVYGDTTTIEGYPGEHTPSIRQLTPNEAALYPLEGDAYVIYYDHTL
jgi:hypothetical protein